VPEQWLYSTNKEERALVLEKRTDILISWFCIANICIGSKSGVFAALGISKRDIETAVILFL